MSVVPATTLLPSVGAAAARMFAANGASVVLGDLLPDLEDIAAEIRHSGGKAVAKQVGCTASAE